MKRVLHTLDAPVAVETHDGKVKLGIPNYDRDTSKVWRFVTLTRLEARELAALLIDAVQEA